MVLVAGFAVFLWTLATPEIKRNYFQWGVFQVSFAYDQAIPLIAFGGALARVSLVPAFFATLLFGASFAAGLFAHSPLLSYIGPLSLIVAGAMLIAPGRLRAWITPPLAVMLGMTIAMTISFDAPRDINWLSYVAGGTQIGAWFIAMASLLWQLVPLPYVRIATPIMGSWLIAIGLLLEGATIAEQARPPSGQGATASCDEACSI